MRLTVRTALALLQLVSHLSVGGLLLHTRIATAQAEPTPVPPGSAPLTGPTDSETCFYDLHYVVNSNVVPVLSQIVKHEFGDTDVAWIVPTDAERRIVLCAPKPVQDRVRKLLVEMDRRTPQVLLETRVLEIMLGRELDVGVEWSFMNENSSGIQQGLALGGPQVNAPGPLAGNGLKYSILSPSTYRGLIRAFAIDEKSHLIAAPHIAALDGQKAKLNIGQSIPILSSTRLDEHGTLNQQYEYEHVGIELDLTPRIAANRDVILLIDNLAVDELLSYDEETYAHVIGRRSVSTRVAVQDGHTLVIGGLIRETNDEIRKGIPLLKDIPLLGALFRTTEKRPSKAEILIFLTPTVMRTSEEADAVSADRKAQSSPQLQSPIE